jgi:hypothetical protein
LVSTPVTDATTDSLIIGSVSDRAHKLYSKSELGIEDEGKVYQFYCVVVSGSQYGISSTGRVVYGTGARLANGGWIRVANANLGARQDFTLEQQLAYEPSASSSGEANNPAYDPIVYGDWYQWGRAKDGHENRKTAASGTNNSYYSTTDGVETGKLDPANGQILSSETNFYGKFIQRNEGNRRVPTQDEWAQIQSNNTWIWQEGGSYSLYFTSGNISAAYTHARSLGLTVRCVSSL